jgi:hypothetical protein
MYVRAQLASLRRFRRRARAIGDVHGSPRFTIGLATLAFDAETHDFWHVVTCQRCAASEERTVHDLSEIGTERLYVCGDCAQVPLQEGPRDDASIDPMVPSDHRPAVPDASSLSVTQNGDAAASREAADEKPGQAASAERRATEERSEAARAEGAARDAAAVVAQAELHATELGNDAVRIREAAEKKLAQSVALMADAERKATAVRADAEAEASRTRQAAEEELAQAVALMADAERKATAVRADAEAEAARIRQAAEEELAQAIALGADAEEKASAVRAAAEAEAARTREAAEQKLEQAVTLIAEAEVAGIREAAHNYRAQASVLLAEARKYAESDAHAGDDAAASRAEADGPASEDEVRSAGVVHAEPALDVRARDPAARS